jgi:hypothetical protein
VIELSSIPSVPFRSAFQQALAQIRTDVRAEWPWALLTQSLNEGMRRALAKGWTPPRAPVSASSTFHEKQPARIERPAVVARALNAESWAALVPQFVVPSAA